MRDRPVIGREGLGLGRVEIGDPAQPEARLIGEVGRIPLGNVASAHEADAE
jgi:hypothetical protein